MLTIQRRFVFTALVAVILVLVLSHVDVAWAQAVDVNGLEKSIWQRVLPWARIITLAGLVISIGAGILSGFSMAVKAALGVCGAALFFLMIPELVNLLFQNAH